MKTVPFTGVIGSRLVGVDPFDQKSWSGISRFFFSECQRQGLLRRAIGGEVSHPLREVLMLRRFHLNRRSWRLRYFLDPGYRNALTKEIARKLEASDFDGGFLQIGAMFDLPSIVEGRSPCFSYHDGNLALRLKSPEGHRGLASREIDKAMEYERSVYDGLDRIFTMSEYLRRSFIEDFDQPEDKVVCIGAGANFERVPVPGPEKDYSRKEVLFVGVEFERKGGRVLLDAFSRIREKYPDAILHVVGPKPESVHSLRPEMEHGVETHGFLQKSHPDDRMKLQRLFSRSSLFVLPSLYEPFGIAPVEAMMNGIPAVVSGDWALGETVEDGVIGWHVIPGDVESLVDVLDKALANPDERCRRGRLAAENARKFQWSSVVDRLRESLEEMET